MVAELSEVDPFDQMLPSTIVPELTLRLPLDRTSPMTNADDPIEILEPTQKTLTLLEVAPFVRATVKLLAIDNEESTKKYVPAPLRVTPVI
jgi:hypothetical protein